MNRSKFALLIRLSEAQNHRCAYCQLPIHATSCSHYKDSDRATADHIVPRAYLGPDDPENMVAACVRCNLAKGPRNAKAFYRKLQKVLAQLPDRAIWHTMHHEQWMRFMRQHLPPGIRRSKAERRKRQVKIAKRNKNAAFELAELIRREEERL